MSGQPANNHKTEPKTPVQPLGSPILPNNQQNSIPIDTIRLSSIEQARSDASYIITSRKRKIAELYTVSTLRKLRSIKTDEEVRNVKGDLDGFLERCDLERGVKFNLDMLKGDVDLKARAGDDDAMDVDEEYLNGNTKEIASSQNNLTDIKETTKPSLQSQEQNTSPQTSPVLKSGEQSSTPATTSLKPTPTPENKLRPDLDLITKLKSLSQSQSQIKPIPVESSQSSPQTTPKVEVKQIAPTQTPSETSAKASETPVQHDSAETLPLPVPKEQPNVSYGTKKQPEPHQKQSKPQSHPLSQSHSVKLETATGSSSSSNSHSQLQAQQVQKAQYHSNRVQQQIQSQPQKTILSKLKGRRKLPNDRKSLFDANNPESIETLILVLKENLPAKVVESTPLAELYYLAQTLPLSQLLPAAHKVVTTSVFESAYTEGKINVIHSRIEDLKWQGKWSLRQPTKYVDPFKRKVGRSHWDNTLSEMNWMSTDFRELRKFKIATCFFIAESVMDYWKYGKVCCIKPAPINYLPSDEDVEMADDAAPMEEKADEDDEMKNETKESEVIEVEINEVDTIDISKLLERPDPSAEIKALDLPTTSSEEYERIKEKKISAFKPLLDIDDLKHNDRMLLDNIPAFTSFEQFNDKFEKLPLAPVSRSLVPIEDETWYSIYSKQQIDETPFVPSQQKGLFGFSSQKRMSTSIKPPEPPSLKFLEERTPAIWLPEEDQKLIEYVNQFSFNWGIVSAHLQKTKSQRSYQSNIERRSPWQCFERYIQLNDAFDINEMRGVYHNSAMQWLKAAHNLQATTKRRISPLGVGLDSIQRGHKRLRWASLFDGIRKEMKKRESVTRPNPAQTRKFTDEKILETPTPTPGDLAELKYQREKAMHDNYIQEQNKKLANDQRRGATPASQARPNSAHPVNTGPPPTPQIINSAPHQGPPQPGVQMQVAPQSADQIQASLNASPLVQQTLMNRANAHSPIGNKIAASNFAQTSSPSMAQQQLTAGGQRVNPPTSAGQQVKRQYTPEQVQQLMQLQKQKKALQQQQQHQQQQQPVQVPSSAGAPQMIPSFGRSNSNPLQMAPSSSPSMANSTVAPRTSSPSIGSPQLTDRKFMSMLMQKVKQQHPDWSQEQVVQYAKKYVAQARANQNGANQNLNGQRVQTQSPQLQQRAAVPTPQQILQEQAMRSASPSVNLNQQLNMRPNTAGSASISPTPLNHSAPQQRQVKQVKQTQRVAVPTPQQIQAPQQAQLNATPTPQQLQAQAQAQAQAAQQRLIQQQQRKQAGNGGNGSVGGPVNFKGSQ